MIFHNTLDIANVVRELQAEGRPVDPLDLAQVSPYLTEHIKRFGEYSNHELGITPDDYDARLDVDFSMPPCAGLLLFPGTLPANRSNAGYDVPSLSPATPQRLMKSVRARSCASSHRRAAQAPRALLRWGAHSKKGRSERCRSACRRLPVRQVPGGRRRRARFRR